MQDLLNTRTVILGLRSLDLKPQKLQRGYYSTFNSVTGLRDIKNVPTCIRLIRLLIIRLVNMFGYATICSITFDRIQYRDLWFLSIDDLTLWQEDFFHVVTKKSLSASDIRDHVKRQAMTQNCDFFWLSHIYLSVGPYHPILIFDHI